ncbi:hypothetical protein VARIO8X_70056 [Burkholderiales bacterium 8X]|nr:hypothetical protein VARIO8X_70056 [Burkholderiales bacterium 8X]
MQQADTTHCSGPERDPHGFPAIPPRDLIISNPGAANTLSSVMG